MVVGRRGCKVVILSIVSLSIYGCSESSLTTRIGNTDVCIPNHFMNNLGSSSSSDEADKARPVYMSMSIDPPYIQQEVPAYSGALGEEWSWRYKSLHITITNSEPYNGAPPKASEFDTFFSKPNPNLVGYRNEPPFVSWDAFEIQSDNTRKYWGICFDFSNPSLSFLECKRALTIEDLEFMYSVSGSNNIDLYPAIDKYLTEKVTKEWRCDSSS